MISRRRHTAGDHPDERGAVLIVLVVAVVVMMILMGQASQAWSTITVREREAEFLSRTTQFAHAVKRYQQDNQKLPSTVKELLEPGPNGNSRYLRKAWKDPLTGEDFVLLWLAPDGASLFRSDGKPSSSGSFGNARRGSLASGHNQNTSLNMQQLTIPLGSPGYDAEKTLSLLDAYKKQTENPIGARGGGSAQPFAANPQLNMGNFDTGSNLLETPGMGPIVGLATSFEGTAFLEYKGRDDYAGFEVSIFSLQDEQLAQTTPGMAPKRNKWEMPGVVMPDPLSPAGMKMLNTDPAGLHGESTLDKSGRR